MINNEQYWYEYKTRPALSLDLISTRRRALPESLDGVWHYHPDPYDTARRDGWFSEPYRNASNERIPWDFDFEHWPTMRLPATWNVEDSALFHYEESVVFARRFDFARGNEGKVLIRCGAIAYAATVFLNGTYVGHHAGGSTPFVIDVTGTIAAENLIVICVENRRGTQRVPALNTDWFNYGGIHRGIEILRLPQRYIQHMFAGLVPGSDHKKLFLDIFAGGLSETNGTEAAIPATVTIPELGLNVVIPLESGHGRIELEATPELWCPHNPKRYQIITSLEDDTVIDWVGFREVRRAGDQILLNGEPVFLRGISMHEESVEHGRTLSEAEIRENMRLVKELGGNFARLAHYPHSETASRIADEVGLLLWEEVPVYWSIDFASEEAFADANNQLQELILRDRNRASVIIWSVGNENPDTDDRLQFMTGLVETCRHFDGTRLVSAACLINTKTNRIDDRLEQQLDLIGVNQYMGWYQPDFSKLGDLLENSAPEKPVIITEFGGGALAGHHGTRTDLFTEENQAWIYRRQVEAMQRIPYIRGMSPWILYDFRSPRRLNRFQNGYNRKGLLSENKRDRKTAFFTLQEFYQALNE